MAPGNEVLHFEGNKSQLKDFVSKAAGLVVVDFFATWCGPCKMLGKVLPDIAEKYPKVKFLKTDIDVSHELASDYDIRVVPQIKFFKAEDAKSENLKEVATVVGADVARIKSTIDEFQ